MATAPSKPDFGRFQRIAWCLPDLRLTPEAAREMDLLMQGLPPALLTVARLPAATPAREGARAYVVDATLAAAGNFGGAVAGGGANKTPVWCNGAGWFIG
jgi:hypothetical protein